MYKNKKVIFRVNEKLYTFISDFSRSNGLEISELMRNIVTYFFMSWIMGDIKKPYNQLREEFIESTRNTNLLKQGKVK
jgi:hypothetical protein